MENVTQVKRLYEENIYGVWRSGEQVTYSIREKSRRVNVVDPDRPFLRMFQLSTDDAGRDVEIHVAKDGREGGFTVRAYIPESSAAAKWPKGCPFIVCMHPIQPLEYCLENGYAVIFMDTSMVAEDNNLRRGCFYDIYPYTKEAASQTGELMAWGWAAAKVLDCIEAGLGEELGLNPGLSMLTGVSRWGKATAVCGAFEKRFRAVVPVCSGAGGLALWGYKSEGKQYDLTAVGGPCDYTYGQNEPLSCLQSEAEQGWFVDRFLQYEKYEDIPVEQYMLPVLAAAPDRYYIIVAAWMGEDWVNAPAMWECYEKALEKYTQMGLGDRLHAAFHREGHAVLQEDLERIFRIIEE